MKKKILIVQFTHETNSFCPQKADMQAYKNMIFLMGNDMFDKQRGQRSGVGGFLDVLEKYGEFELVPSVALSASPSGPVTADVYDFVLKEVTAAIKEHSLLDGVLINFHGAMVAEGHDDGEGDLMEVIRSMVGWDIPIIATLDLHANVTDKMAKCATVMVPFEEYPHIDTYETGCRAAEIMAQTLLGNIKPVMSYRKIPFLQPLLPSASDELSPIYALAKELNAKEEMLSVRFTHGFFPADIAELGMSVLAIADGNSNLADECADKLCNFILDSIPKLKAQYMTLDEALNKSVSSEGIFVLADSSDNPGAGGVGDTTHILREVLKRGIKGVAIATITDYKFVEKCVSSGVGTIVESELGGWSDPQYSGGPLKVSAYVKKISDGKYKSKAQMSYGVEFNHGKTVVVEIEGNYVIVTSISRQPYDIEIFRNHGITPEDQKILVVKSAIHYRATFKDVATEMIPLSLSGYSVPTPEIYQYKKWKGKV